MSDAVEPNEVDELDEETVDARAAEISGDRHLTFLLAEQVYGIPLERVQEIVRVQRATPVPDLPEYIRGVINLRGTVVPVVDVRTRLGLAKRDEDERTCVVVCSFRGEGIGLIVDTVCDVVAIDESNIIDAGSGHADGTDQMLRGLHRSEELVTILICLDRMLADDRETDAVVAA